AGGAEQGGFNHIPPAKARVLANKFSQFLQYPFVDGGVANHAAALVGLGLAGFKLRFDERDNLAVRFQQRNGGGQDFAQRDERAINHRHVRGGERRGKMGGGQKARIG